MRSGLRSSGHSHRQRRKPPSRRGRLARSARHRHARDHACGADWCRAASNALTAMRSGPLPRLFATTRRERPKWRAAGAPEFSAVSATGRRIGYGLVEKAVRHGGGHKQTVRIHAPVPYRRRMTRLMLGRAGCGKVGCPVLRGLSSRLATRRRSPIPRNQIAKCPLNCTKISRRQSCKRNDIAKACFRVHPKSD
ncbi:hypothetical protein ABIC01_005815 [Bradyrhizobium sp. RT4b]